MNNKQSREEGGFECTECDIWLLCGFAIYMAYLYQLKSFKKKLDYQAVFKHNPSNLETHTTKVEGMFPNIKLVEWCEYQLTPLPYSIKMQDATIKYFNLKELPDLPYGSLIVHIGCFDTIESYMYGKKHWKEKFKIKE